ncbi:hypothetical protein [uncultured Dokdonia sp.]|uniref:hypothetical protein n=1 Tax=uncultured Dokdonia sp. TaxID=575653 RepID=UPI00262024A1|nr:hypothetical protein [uncultured Dokdonia sp.]
MKKSILYVFAAITFVCTSCSTDNENDLETTASDLETVSLFEIIPDASLDTSNKGLYHGVFSSSDRTRKGEIYVHLGSDNVYRAEVLLNSGELIEFTANGNASLHEILFSNERASFIFDVTDSEHPRATNVTIDNKDGYIQTYKERSNQRIAMVLGSFVDSSDPSFAGNWDIAASSTVQPEDAFEGDGFFTIMDITVSINGNMFNDTDPNTESWGGFGEAGSVCVLARNEFFITPGEAGIAPDFQGLGFPYLEGFNQIATYNGVDISWDASIVPAGSSTGFGCTEFEGTWSGGTRSGTFSFD